MTHKFFPVDRSVLAGDALRDQILSHYDLPRPITCRLYSRYANDIYCVEAGDERFWLRVYQHDEFSEDEIEAYELAVLRWSIGPAVGTEGIGAPRTAEVWDAYLQGYRGVRPLAAEEDAAIPYFVAMRQIRVLGWDVQRALDGRLGTWFLNDSYFDHWIGAMKTWVAEECAPR